LLIVSCSALAISYFFAISQVVGSMGPLIFANFVGNGTDRVPLFWGYVLGSGVMIFGGLVAWFFGVDAEGKGLEDIAAPLTSVKPAVAWKLLSFTKRERGKYCWRPAHCRPPTGSVGGAKALKEDDIGRVRCVFVASVLREQGILSEPVLEARPA
jgi:hypothetical protein